MTHTPRPWATHPDDDFYIVAEPNSPNPIVIGEIRDSWDGREDARLIAAAPDLLEAAQFALTWFKANGYCGAGSSPDAILQHAINKATKA